MTDENVAGENLAEVEVTQAEVVASEEPGGSERLEVSFELNEGDALAGYFYGFLGHPLVRRRMPLAFFFFLMMEVGFGLAIGPSAGIALMAAAILGLGFLIPMLVRMQARRNPRFRGPHTAWITPELVGGWTEGVGTTRITWSHVHDVGDTRSHLLIYWRAGASTLIPKAAFASPEAAEEFFQTAQRWWRAANAS